MLGEVSVILSLFFCSTLDAYHEFQDQNHVVDALTSRYHEFKDQDHVVIEFGSHSKSLTTSFSAIQEELLGSFITEHEDLEFLVPQSQQGNRIVVQFLGQVPCITQNRGQLPCITRS